MLDLPKTYGTSATWNTPTSEVFLPRIRLNKPALKPATGWTKV